MGTVTSDIPPDMLEEALRLGWSPAILERGLAAGMTHTKLRRMLGWGLPAEHMEKKIDWHVRLHSGLHAREATDDDGEGFSELCRSSPIETGDWEVTTEHEPNAFAQFRLQEHLNLLLIADGPTLVASCGFSTRNVLVGGERLSVRYGQALRVHRDYRRQGFGDQVRSLGWGIGCSRPSAVQYDIMRLGNFAVVGWWEKYFPDFFDDVPDQGEGVVPGLPVEVMQYPARSAEDDRTIRPASRADIPRCAELINRTHQGLDLFRPYSEEFLANRLDEGFWGERPFWWSPVYCWDDYRVVEEGGRIVACGGLWDRGRDLRDRWRHRQTGQERVIADTALMDFGFETGAEAAMGRLIGHFLGRTQTLGRDQLLAPIQELPALRDALADLDGTSETRALRWGATDPQVERPYTDLAYW